MERWIDTTAVLLLLGATALVGLHARGLLGGDTHVPDEVATEETYAARVAAALPHLERHVAAGSMRARDVACGEENALAEVAAIEATLGERGDADHAISAPLAEGIAALRECLACTPEPRGCAAAARAFTVIEERLGLPRTASGI